MSDTSSFKEDTLLVDDIEMTAMPIETGGTLISKGSNEDTSLNCLPNTSISQLLCSNNEQNGTRRRTNIADLVSYIGFRGVALIVAFKVVGLIVFAMFFMSYTSTLDAGDVSHVTLSRGRLENLREKIRETTLAASAIGISEQEGKQAEKVLFTLPVAKTHVYGRYIEFIMSYPREASQSSGDSWQSSKDSTSTLTTGSTAAEIAATRQADKLTNQDPLSVHTVAPALVVHSFKDVPFTVLLNKFNTVKDHCLLVTNEFAPQIAPFQGTELELWHWTLLQTRGVGFYNSNGLAGASQAHRHMQFIPGDAIWSMRNKDATHALPIDDIVMPPIEAGVWRAFPFSSHYDSSNKDLAKTGQDKYKYQAKKDTLVPLHDKLQTAMLHQLKQFDFQHGVAVLLDRSSFLAYGDKAAQAYSDYLQQAYEALLRSNGINIDTLRQCAAASLNPDSNKPDTTTSSNIHSNNRDSVVEHDDLPVTHTDSPYEATEPLNCLDAVAYNIILRP
eukprot:gene19038-21655_t